MTEDLRRRRELSISDYCFMIHAESVLTDRRGYSYLVHTPSSRSVRLGGIVDDSVSDVTRRLVACALALLVAGTFGAAIWFAFFAPGLAAGGDTSLRSPAVTGPSGSPAALWNAS